MEPVSGGGLPSPESPGFLSEQLHRRAPRDTEGASAEAHRLTSSFSGGCRRPARPQTQPGPRTRAAAPRPAWPVPARLCGSSLSGGGCEEAAVFLKLLSASPGLVTGQPYRYGLFSMGVNAHSVFFLLFHSRA